MKNVPGKKTDIKDAEWIARLLRSGLLSGSFIPPQDILEPAKNRWISLFHLLTLYTFCEEMSISFKNFYNIL